MKNLLKYFLLTVLVFSVLDVSGRLLFPRRAPVSKIISKAEKTVTIPEGWTLDDIARYFEETNNWPREEFLNAVGWPRVDYRRREDRPAPKDYAAQFSFLEDKPDYYGLEGYFFPDTYRIYASSTVEDVIVKILANFDLKLTPQMRADIKKQEKTIYQIVTMASIIEKEAPISYEPGGDRDAKIISGIFWDRLKIGQALQSDATLSYILGDNKPQHSGEELDNISPYNTYEYRGLPPGPICNPGQLAIKAAIYPIYTDYNYFLTPPGKKEVIYARTYEEHLQNKYKYLK